MNRRFIMALLASAVIALGIGVNTTAAPTPAQKCLAKKLKEIGKYDSCRLKAEAKGVTRGLPPDFSDCVSRLTAKWGIIEGAGGCTFPGDLAMPQAITETHADQTYDLLANGALPACGDGAINGAEDCDGVDLGGETCVTQGYTGGILACDGSCAFDTSACVLAGCGNATLDIGEQCDGVELNGLECSDLGFSDNTGTLACSGVCELDTSGCVELCGNGTVDVAAFESCDGVDLNGSDCTTFGLTGTLGCTTSCSYDLSGCAGSCGNGVQELSEECDGVDLDFESCSSLDFVGGTLACTVGCEFDTSGCTATCGDNVTSEGAGEECDGTNTPSDCTALFYHSGSPSCTGSCTLDVSACVLDCDYLDQDCAIGEGCYFDLGLGGGGCQPAGSGGPFESCSVQSDCAPKHYCAPAGGATTPVCTPLCDATIGDADCPAGFGYSCFAVPLPVEPDFGVCLAF